MSTTSQAKLNTPCCSLEGEQAQRRQLEELERLRKERERLLAETAAAKAKAVKFAARVEAEKAKNQKLRDEMKAVKAEKTALAKEVAGLKKQEEAAQQMAIVLLTALLKALNIELAEGNDLPKADLQRVADALDEVTSLLLTATQCSGILKYVMSKHSEVTKRLFKGKKPTKPTAEDLKNKIEVLNKRLKGIEAEEKALNSTLEVHQDGAAAAAATAPDDPASQAAGRIASHPAPEAPEQDAKANSNGKQTAGRQALNKENFKPFSLFNNGQNGKWQYVCSRCGKNDAWTLVGKKEVILRSLSALVSELLQVLNVEVPVYQCGHCGFVHQEFPEGASVPCREKQGTMSAALVVQTGVAQTAGVPVNRMEGMLIPDKDEHQIGSDTILRNTHLWAYSGPGHYLMLAVLNAVYGREGIAFDETPTEILQHKGQSKKTVKSVSKQGNILVVSSLPGDPQPFAIYNRADGRSIGAIKAVLANWMPDVVVTDGCTTYNTVLEQLKADRKLPAAILHQICCVHFRRLCLKAVDIPTMEAVMLKPNGAEVAAKGIQSKKPEFLILSVIDAFSKIYAYEEKLKRLPDEDTQAWHDRILESRKLHATPLMDDIDQLMEAMVPACAKEEKGHWVAISKTSPLHKAVVYYKVSRP